MLYTNQATWKCVDATGIYWPYAAWYALGPPQGPSGSHPVAPSPLPWRTPAAEREEWIQQHLQLGPPREDERGM